MGLGNRIGKQKRRGILGFEIRGLKHRAQGTKPGRPEKSCQRPRVSEHTALCREQYEPISNLGPVTITEYLFHELAITFKCFLTKYLGRERYGGKGYCMPPSFLRWHCKVSRQLQAHKAWLPPCLKNKQHPFLVRFSLRLGQEYDQQEIRKWENAERYAKVAFGRTSGVSKRRR